MNVLDAWQKIPAQIEAVLRQRKGALDEPVSDGLTVRELVHHFVEAHVVAASIVIAGLGSPGCTYDWSWMQPFGVWNEHMAYNKKPIEPAMKVLHALNAYIAAQISPLADGLSREVSLRDTATDPPRRATIADVLQTEVDHVTEHLG